MTEEDARWVEVSPLERLADQAILGVRVEAVDLLLVRDGGNGTGDTRRKVPGPIASMVSPVVDRNLGLYQDAGFRPIQLIDVKCAL
jgi:hypothetical protein